MLYDVRLAASYVALRQRKSGILSLSRVTSTCQFLMQHISDFSSLLAALKKVQVARHAALQYALHDVLHSASSASGFNENHQLNKQE